jgi:hypothetical protein
MNNVIRTLAMFYEVMWRRLGTPKNPRMSCGGRVSRSSAVMTLAVKSSVLGTTLNDLHTHSVML